MKLSEATTIKKLKHAIETPDVKIRFTEHGNKVTSIIVALTGKPEKVFEVKKYNVLKAWKEVEVYCKNLK